MTNAPRKSDGSFWQVLQLLFMPSRRQAPSDVLAPRLKLALSLPLLVAGAACILTAAVTWLSLGKLMSDNVTETEKKIEVTRNEAGQEIFVFATETQPITVSDGILRSEPVREAFAAHQPLYLTFSSDRWISRFDGKPVDGKTISGGHVTSVEYPGLKPKMKYLFRVFPVFPAAPKVEPREEETPKELPRVGFQSSLKEESETPVEVPVAAPVAEPVAPPIKYAVATASEVPIPATPGTKTFALSWPAVEGAEGYRIECFEGVRIGPSFETLIVVLSTAAILGGLVLLGGASLAWKRRDGSLGRVRKFYIAGYIIPLVGVYLVGEAMNVLLLGPGTDKSNPSTVILYEHYFLSNWWIVPIKTVLIVGLLAVEAMLIAAHLLARSDEAAALYKSGKVARQELTIVYAGTGKDRRVWTSRFHSLGLHALVILVLPWLLIFGAWTSTLPPYEIPGGDGGGGPVEVVKATMKKVKPKRKIHVLANIKSPIRFDFPDITQSDVQDQVEKDTSATYTATGGGGFGAGGKGSKPGWKKGKGTGEIRFIRLEHSGKAWDDGMRTETGRADQNFLEFINSETGFKIRTPESIPIASLKLYKKGQAPPFVFLTGHNLAGITTSDWKTLRQYCIDGGLIFADASGPQFDNDFRRLMRDVFPDQPLSDIPNDDPIYSEPYRFPDGAPALWSHGRNPRAMGVRAPGTSRLCVFYHPGDIHDAWKSGNSGLSQDKVNSAFKLGMNIISYAFTNYLNMHYPD